MPVFYASQCLSSQISVGADDGYPESADANVPAARGDAGVYAVRLMDRRANADVGGARHACVGVRDSWARAHGNVRELP